MRVLGNPFFHRSNVCSYVNRVGFLFYVFFVVRWSWLVLRREGSWGKSAGTCSCAMRVARFEGDDYAAK